jgi:hypothetical protein
MTDSKKASDLHDFEAFSLSRGLLHSPGRLLGFVYWRTLMLHIANRRHIVLAAYKRHSFQETISGRTLWTET